MIDRRIHSLLAVLALALLPAWGFAQVDATALARDTHIFRRLFHSLGSTPTLSIADLQINPRETVLVVLGDVTILNDFANIADWVRKGGSLLVATDRGRLMEELVPFGVVLYGASRAPVRAAEDEGYRGLRDCPFVIPTHIGPALFQSGKNSLNQVATNRSGLLANRNSPLKVIARFPENATVNSRGVIGDGLGFAMAGDFGSGRVLIMADHSVFINAMLWQNDNQNLDFALNCVDWLTENGRRQSVFFFDEGIIQSSFDIPLREIPAPPLPSPEALVAAFNQVMSGLERENRFNQLILNMTANNFSHDRATALAIIGLSFVAGLFALQRLNAAKHRREHGTVPLAATVANLELGRPIHELRTQGLSEQGNYWEAAHELAIEIFEPLLAACAPGGRLEVAGEKSFWQNRRWRRQVQEVWRLATDPRPRHWTRRQWLHLLGLDHRLRREIVLGSISCLPAAPVPDTAPQSALPKLYSAR